MLNKNFIIIFSIIFLFLTPAVTAAEYNTPELFTEYIYYNYAEKNFTEIYKNFAAELKRNLKEKEYLEFQKNNFEKYNLEYTKIKVSKAQKIEFKEIKAKFDYADDFGNYYKLKVEYLLKFNHFGRREEKSEKFVYLRKIKDDFQIFWNYKEALKNDKNRDDKGE